MSRPTKGKDEIRADPAAFREALGRARAALGQIDGVVSVGFGQKEKGGAYLSDIAIVVVVREKKASDALPPEERIPPDFEGYPTDVLVVREGQLLACQNSTEYGTIQGGIQIVPTVRTADGSYAEGTLGCIVRRRGDASRENVYLLTCKHVLFFGGSGEGDYAYHPFAPHSPGLGSAGPSNALGPIQSVAFRGNVSHRALGMGAPRDFFLDCGTARIDIDSKCFGSTCTKDTTKYDTSIIDLALGADDPATPARDDNMIADVRNVIDDPTFVGQTVYKVGRTTGKTAGIVRRITTVNVSADSANPGGPTIAAHEMIEIDFDVTSTTDHTNCLHNERFAEHGDSGSLVVDTQRRAVGLLAIGPPASADLLAPPRKHGAWACQIVPVLDQLGVCIPTAGGTSHGSCAATDGSGTSLGEAGDFETPHGQVVFAGHSLAGVGVGPATAPAPLCITDEQQHHLLQLRDALRETPRGRELHDTFALVRREIGYLVRNSRPVKVVWHRNQGPAFLVHALNHLKGETATLPREVAGVSRAALLTRMAEVLGAHGSNPLRGAVERHGAEVLVMLSDADSVYDCLASLRRMEPGGAIS
jgi:hypothetical protein